MFTSACHRTVVSATGVYAPAYEDVQAQVLKHSEHFHLYYQDLMKMLTVLTKYYISRRLQDCTLSSWYIALGDVYNRVG